MKWSRLRRGVRGAHLTDLLSTLAHFKLKARTRANKKSPDTKHEKDGKKRGCDILITDIFIPFSNVTSMIAEPILLLIHITLQRHPTHDIVIPTIRNHTARHPVMTDTRSLVVAVVVVVVVVDLDVETPAVVSFGAADALGEV